MSRARTRVDRYLPAAELRSKENRLRHGPARSEREELARLLAFYTRTAWTPARPRLRPVGRPCSW
ncbi:hypothetical protein [Nocardiopsis sp. TNDT3]|uniref:hypothetical protein n=1 Tax=Nocardiopsis TaxID=2013 RepID=UPI001300A6E9|nr:hypothetical protein [Nocardiopsis sp. TNDT3]